MQGPPLTFERVSRTFGDVAAVVDASFAIAPGTVHAILGENGAGKSTLLKMAAGVVAPSAGRILIADSALSPSVQAESIRRGVGMVHQHFMLVGALTVLENMVLGAEPTESFGRLDFAKAERDVGALMDRTGLRVPLRGVTDTLTVGERQRLEILRVLYRGAKAILLDEPTAVLSPLEADELYATLRRLAAEGATVAVVTHRLDEVVRFADRVTIMRRGRVVHERALHDEDRRSRGLEDELTREIMGGEPPQPFAPPPLAGDARSTLEVDDLSLERDGIALLSRLSIRVGAGEIVGVAGVEGNGQRELVRAIAGLEDGATGRILVDGKELSGPPRERRPRLGVVHEDRHAEGLLLEATVGDNLVLGDLGDGDPNFDEASVVATRIASYGVRPANPAALARDLSGGNQQKLVIARAIERIVRQNRGGALVLAQPTRGVDVGAAAAIHAAIGEAAKAGLSVLVVSADLAELRRLSHRLVVMHRGAIVAELGRDTPEAVVGRAMLGMEAA